VHLTITIGMLALVFGQAASLAKRLSDLGCKSRPAFFDVSKFGCFRPSRSRKPLDMPPKVRVFSIFSIFVKSPEIQQRKRADNATETSSRVTRATSSATGPSVSRDAEGVSSSQ
jgi:hypothetical protein